MPFGMGFGRGFGRGFAGWAYGPYGYGAYPVWGWGGRGNPFPFCRNFPWLPRWWWATPNAAQYGATIPYYGYGFPYYGTGYPYAYPGFAPPGYPGVQQPAGVSNTSNE